MGFHTLLLEGLHFFIWIIFVPQRKHVYRSQLPVTGIALLFSITCCTLLSTKEAARICNVRVLVVSKRVTNVCIICCCMWVRISNFVLLKALCASCCEYMVKVSVTSHRTRYFDRYMAVANYIAAKISRVYWRNRNLERRTVFENRVLSRISEPERSQTVDSGHWGMRSLNLYSLSNIVRFEQMQTRWR
jgi:hypothetical protein